MKMISYAHKTGLEKQELQFWCVYLQRRYDLEPDVDIRGIVTTALAIDGMNMAIDMNSPSLVNKARRIELLESWHWDHQVVLDILYPRNQSGSHASLTSLPVCVTGHKRLFWAVSSKLTTFRPKEYQKRQLLAKFFARSQHLWGSAGASRPANVSQVTRGAGLITRVHYNEMLHDSKIRSRNLKCHTKFMYSKHPVLWGRNLDTRFEVYPWCSKNMKCTFGWGCTFHIFGMPWAKFKFCKQISFTQNLKFHGHKFGMEL